jgi:uncharacterized membrane protein YraQ (UPF0718 family)
MSGGCHHNVKKRSKFQKIGGLATAIFVITAIAALFRGMNVPDQNLLPQIAINFTAIVFEAMPFMLIGSVFGGLIEVYVPREWLASFLARGQKRVVFAAAAMGFLFPVCECAVVPVVRRLVKKGVPAPAAIAYLLAAPIVNPIVIASTFVAYNRDWRMPALRLVLGYVVAVITGLIIGRFTKEKDILLDSIRPQADACSLADRNASVFQKITGVFQHACDDFFEVGRYLIIGAFIAALLRTVVSMETFHSIASQPWLAILVMMVMAVALNLCSEADAFIAACFRNVLPGTSQLAFLVLGPMLDIKLILMYTTLFKRRAIILLPILLFVLVFASIFGVHLLIGGRFYAVVQP